MCFVVAADTCLNPQVHEAVYTSTEAHMSYDAVFVIEFTLSCKNGLKVCVVALWVKETRMRNSMESRARV